MTRHLLRDDDLTQAEQAEILDLAVALKKDRWKLKPLAGPQTVAVIFDKTSTRTRVSFATGIADLGGVPLIINPGEAQLGAKESIGDTARVLERQVAAVVWRTYAQSGLEEMAAGTRIPIVSPEQLVAASPDRVLLFISDLLPEVRRAMPGVIGVRPAAIRMPCRPFRKPSSSLRWQRAHAA